MIDGEETYCYNERNELTEKRTPSVVVRYQYDLLNHQTAVQMPDGRVQENLYDGQVVELYSDAFKNRETLVKTRGLERTHVMQITLYESLQDSLTCGLFEDAATLSENDWWNYYNSVNGDH